jgi:hypothetical protein
MKGKCIYYQSHQCDTKQMFGVFFLRTDDNNDKPKHNTTTYCVYLRTTTTINPVIIRPHIVFTDGQQQRQANRPSVNTTCGRIMIGFIVVVRQ